MADLNTQNEPTDSAQPNSMLSASLTRWLSPVETSSSIDPEVGYESALPWTLGEAPNERAYD